MYTPPSYITAVLCQLVEELGGENVVQEMGGSLAYSHEIWLGNRLVSVHSMYIAHISTAHPQPSVHTSASSGTVHNMSN